MPEDNTLKPWAMEAVADAALDRVASEIRGVLADLAGRIHPFPAFLDMATIRAVEVELQGMVAPGHGCVVVCADGELYELNLRAIQGPLDLAEVDHVEEFQPLDLPPVQYVPYAHAAIKALMQHLGRK